jgi:hypothetical protein
MTKYPDSLTNHAAGTGAYNSKNKTPTISNPIEDNLNNWTDRVVEPHSAESLVTQRLQSALKSVQSIKSAITYIENNSNSEIINIKLINLYDQISELKTEIDVIKDQILSLTTNSAFDRWQKEIANIETLFEEQINRLNSLTASAA